MSASG